MDLTSSLFLLCLAALLVVYYLTPKRAQWCVLLAASWAYYLYTDVRAGAFLLASTLITYFCARAIGRIYRADPNDRRRAKAVLLAGIRGLHLNEMVVKVAAQILVLVGNYVISKFLVFRK